MANAQVDTQFIPNNRGGRSLVYQGYKYRVKRTRGTSIHWKCCISTCPATINTSNDYITTVNNIHNHGPNHSKIAFDKFYSSVKDMVKEDSRSIHSIYLSGLHDESDAKVEGFGCGRHCTWLNWFSWGNCSTNCGCGTKERKRHLCCSRNILNNGTLCADDCGVASQDYKDTKPCTKWCPSKNETDGCSLCTWHNWGSWSSCSSDCGGGHRSRSRSPCCCNQTLEECLKDCGLLETNTTQEKACNQLCFHGGSFINKSCVCKAGYAGKCCSTEVMVADCKKCSWQAWQAWEGTGEDGKMRRRRELCCRIGQSAEDCRSECGAEKHSQVQILMNDTATGAKLGTPYTDLNLFLYAVGIALVSIIVTSLVWVGCCYLKMKKRKEAEDDPGTEHVYEMSVSEQGVDHGYAGLDPGSINSDDNL